MALPRRITPEYNKIVDEYTAAVELILNQKADLDEAIDTAAAKSNAIVPSTGGTIHKNMRTS